MRIYLWLLCFALLVVSACKKEGVSPLQKQCHLSSVILSSVTPGGIGTDTQMVTYFTDSIVSKSLSNTEVYIPNSNNKTISYKYYTSNGVLSLIGAYYLDSDGFIDSFIRRDANTLAVNYRKRNVRNAQNRITAEYISYINYGYNRNYRYNINGDYIYSTSKGFGSVTVNDSIVYTFDSNKINNGSPTYVLEDLHGKQSANHFIKRRYYNRVSGEVTREDRFTYGELDADGNVTSVLYEIDYMPGSIFNAEYSYDRAYSFTCE